MDIVRPSVYREDWKKLEKSKHVLHDRERANRYLTMRNDDFVVLALSVIGTRKMYLFMDSGNILVIDGNLLITILTSNMVVNHSVKLVDLDPVEVRIPLFTRLKRLFTLV